MRKKAFSRVVQKVFPDAKAVAAPAPPRRAPREEADSKSLLAALVKQYFDWIVAERQLSARTVHSYRDAMVLFLRYIVTPSRSELSNSRSVTILSLTLSHFCGIWKVTVVYPSRREIIVSVLSGRFVASLPTRIHCSRPHAERVSGVPLKKDEQKLLDDFEPEEMEAMIDAASTANAEGRRNRALLLMLYNTGCRASELASIGVSDVTFANPQHVRILGKGRRWRTVPLWERTAIALREMLHDRSDEDDALFIGQRRNRITRYGVLYVVRQHAKLVIDRFPELRTRRLSPHTVRHTTAVALLRATSDIDAVSKVLGPREHRDHAHLYRQGSLAACADHQQDRH